MGTHFVVQVDNRPGALASLTRALAARGIDIREISAAGAGEHGYVVLTTDDEAATRIVLRSFGQPFVEGEPLIIEIEDRPGGLATVAEMLAAAGVDIRGVLFLGRSGGIVETAFSVDDVGRARRALGIAEPGSGG